MKIFSYKENWLEILEIMMSLVFACWKYGFRQEFYFIYLSQFITVLSVFEEKYM
jgi:hypothetical protein